MLARVMRFPDENGVIAMNLYRSKWIVAAALVGGCLAWATAADATVSILSVDGSLPAGATRDNLDWLGFDPAHDPTTSAGGTSPTSGLFISFSDDGGAAQNSTSVYTAPEITAGNDAGFGMVGPTDTTIFASAGGKQGSSATLQLPGSHNLFGLLWGSVDTFNVLTFKDANGHDIGTISGSDLIGTQGAQEHGSYYVIIGSDVPIDRVIATSSDYAFEFDNVAFGNVTTTPEPFTLSLFGAGLAGLGFVRRRKA